MTTLDDLDALLSAAADSYQRLKTAAVRHHRPDPPAMLTIVRDGRVVAVCSQPEGDGEAVAEMLTAAVEVFRADAIALAADTYLYESEDAGGIGPGELAQRWQAGRREGITEGILVTAMERSGRQDFIALPYARKGRALTWSGLRRFPDSPRGRLPDSLHRAFERQPGYEVETKAYAALLGMDDASRDQALDCMAVATMVSIGCGVGCEQEPGEGFEDAVREFLDFIMARRDAEHPEG